MLGRLYNDGQHGVCDRMLKQLHFDGSAGVGMRDKVDEPSERSKIELPRFLGLDLGPFMKYFHSL